MTLGSFGATLVTLVVLAPFSTSLAAQRPGPDSTARDSLRRYSLAPIQVTASAVPASPGEIGVATSVIGLRSLVPEPAPYASRALALLPGASVDEAAGPAGPAALHLRGGDEPFTQMLFDGVPINISGGFNDIDGLLLTNVERVEVARGPLSALWGSSAMAGAVQFLTREGEPGPAHAEIRLEGGGAGARGGEARSELTASGGSEGLRWSSGVGLAYARGVYALPNDLRTGDVSLRLDAAPAPRWSVTAVARYAAIQTNLPVRDPGATRVPLDPTQRERHYRWIGSLGAAWAATPTSHHRLTAALLWDDFVYHDARDTTLDPTAYPFFVANFNLEARSALLRPSLEYVGSSEVAGAGAPSRVVLAYGARWQREMESSSQSGDFGPAQTFFGRNNVAVYTEAQARIRGWLSLLAGARVEKFQGLTAELLPRASLVVSVVPERLSLRAAVGRAFKAPNVDQQYLENPFTEPNRSLKPETSVGWEVGTTLQGGTGPNATTLGLGYFEQRYDDLIQTVPADTGTKQTNKNLGRTRARGVELELERTWSARLRTGGTVSWVATAVLDNTGLDSADYPVGGALPAVPRVTGNAWVAGDLSRSLAAFVRVALVGPQTVFTERFAGQRVETAAYSLVELSLQWRLMPALALYTRCTNLLNARYMTAYDRPGRPRTAVLGVSAVP